METKLSGAAPKNWHMPDDSGLEIGDWAMYCPLCRWIGEPNTHYPARACNCRPPQPETRIWEKTEGDPSW